MLKKSISLIAIVLLSSCASASAHKPDTLIQDCDKALSAKNKVIKEQDKVIKECQEDLKKADKQDASCRTALKRPYHNPFIMSAVGATIGMIVGGPITIGIGFFIGLIL